MVTDKVEFSSSSDMFEHLKSVPRTVTVTGLVKPTEEKSEGFHFSFNGCGSWIPIPAGMVQHFQPLGKASCGDHHHDLVQLHLARPKGGEGRLFADLLTQTQQAQARIMSQATGGGPGCPDGWYWDASSGQCRPR